MQKPLPALQRGLASGRCPPYLAITDCSAARASHTALIQDLPLRAYAQRYATTSLPSSQEGWWFHPALRFAVKK